MITAYRLTHEEALAESPDPFRPRRHRNRWNSESVQVSYAAEHVALAAMELLAHLGGGGRRLQGYRLFTIAFQEADVEDSSSANPAVNPAATGETRRYGDAWAHAARSLALRVPSIVVPLSYNYLINPNHPRFPHATIDSHGEFLYEERIARLLRRGTAGGR